MSDIIVGDSSIGSAGKVNVMGIDINITQVLGEKIIDQYLAQLSEEDMQKIINYISADLWDIHSRYDYDLQKNIQQKFIKEPEKDYWGHPKSGSYTIGTEIKKHFNQRIGEALKVKVAEIVESADYQHKIEEIANELVEYSINGYKEDMKARVRERLVGNVMDATPLYGNVSLQAVINQIIDQRIGC